MNKRLLVVVGLFIVLAVVAISLIVRPRPFTIGFQALAVNYPMMHTIEGGFFEKQGLKPNVQVYSSANDALDALLGGSLFMDALIPIQNIATVQEKQPGTLGIAALHLSDKEHPIDYLVVSSKSPIKAASQLKGKTIVVFPGSYSETVTRLALSKIGVTNAKFIKRPPADMAQAIQTGEADAGILYDPVATQSTIDGWGRIIERGFWENHLIPVIVVGAYAYNKEAAEKNPDIARRVFAGLESAILDARKNPRKAKASMLKYSPTTEKTLDRLPDSRVVLASEIDPKLINQTLQLYAANGIIPKAVDLKSILRRP